MSRTAWPGRVLFEKLERLEKQLAEVREELGREHGNMNEAATLSDPWEALERIDASVAAEVWKNHQAKLEAEAPDPEAQS